MAYTICALSGCPRVTESRYCPAHQAARDKARGTNTQRGYGRDFLAMRRHYVELHKTQPLTCWRCKQPIPIGEPFHLGHDDDDRSIIKGPEHVMCNLSEAGKASHRFA